MIEKPTVVLLRIPHKDCDDFCSRAIERLDEKSQKRYIRNVENQHTRSSMYAHLLTRLVASKFLDIKNRELVFGTNKHGKPYLNNADNFFFNISHSDDFVAVGFYNKNIGIDIQKISGQKIRVSNKYFTLAEKVYLSQEQDGENNRFYEVWTKKEAYVKYIGKGLAFGIDSFDVFSKELGGNFFYKEIDGFALSVFCPQNAKDTEIINLDFDEFSKLVAETLDITTPQNEI